MDRPKGLERAFLGRVEAIEWRYAPAVDCAGQDPAARQELVTLKDFEELVLPAFSIVRFNGGDGGSGAAPVFNCLVLEMAIFFIAIFGLPDVVCGLVHR